MSTEIRTIGIKFDVSEVESGANRAKKATKDMASSADTDLKRMGSSAKTGGKTVESEGKRVDASTKNTRKGINDLGHAKGFAQMARNARDAGSEARRGMMDVLDAVGLMDNGLARMVRRVHSGWSGLDRLTLAANGSSRATREAGSSAAGAGADVAALGLNGAQAASGLRAAGLGAGALGAAAAIAIPIVIALGAALGALAVAGGIMAAFKAGLPKAAAFEDTKVAFGVLLGSADAAEQKLEDLNKFANKTPFETTGLIQGSRYLETFTQGLLNNEKGWTLVGDAAAGAQQPFEGVAMWVGRLYDGLQSGRPVGEALARLQEMGLVTGEVRNKMEEMQKSGAGVNEIWPILEQSLQRYTGTMDKQSKTWNGLISTIGDEWSTLLRDFAAPIMMSLKPALEAIIVIIQKMAPYAKAFGQALADGIRYVFEVVKNGEIGTALILMFGAAFEWARVAFVGAMALAITGIAQLFITQMTLAVTLPVDIFFSLIAAAIDIAAALFTGDLGGAVEVVTQLFGDGGLAVIMAMGVAINNSLGQAFENVVNAFHQGFFKVWVSISNAIDAKLAKLGKMPGTGMQMPEKLDIFTPAPGGGVGDIFKGASSAVSSVARDALKSHMDKLFEGADMLLPDADIPAAPDLSDILGGGAGGGIAPAAAKAAGTKASTKDLKDNRTELEKLIDRWADLETQMDQTAAGSAQSVANNMSDAFTAMIDGTKTAKEAFSDMASAIISDILRMIIQMQIQSALAGLLGGGTGGGAGVLAGIIPTAHSGGQVGTTAFSGTSMPKFHSGGQSSSEQVVKVEKGESILTRKRAKEIEMELVEARGDRNKSAAGGQPVTIMNLQDPNEIADAVVNNPGAVVNAISKSLPAVRRMVLQGER